MPQTGRAFMSGSDNAFMKSALAMARRGLGQTWPNPSVGALVVSPGDPPELIARGWTMPGGRPHAERVALDKAGRRARGGTLYVTLEPCAHHGRTPPCADAIIAAGITRVVCSAHDPDPRVAGAGIAKLRAAGLTVDEAVLEAEGARLNLGHALRVTQNRPLVQLKLALGSDGLIPRGEGAPAWVTSEQARAHGHLLRARCDAILTGRGTVEADDPALTCRLPGMGARSPVRVVLDSRLSIKQDAKLLSGLEAAPLWLFCSGEADTGKASRLKDAGADIIEAEQSRDGRLNPATILSALAGRGITRLLIEGGPGVAGSFWRANLIDEIYLYRGVKPAGPSGLKPLPEADLEAITNSPSFTLAETRAPGPDTLTIYHSHSV